jgi:hypothetical protein
MTDERTQVPILSSPINLEFCEAISGRSFFTISDVVIEIIHQGYMSADRSSIHHLSISLRVPLILHLYTSEITVSPTVISLS